MRAFGGALDKGLIELRLCRMAPIKLAFGITGRTGDQQARWLAPFDGLEDVVLHGLGFVHDDQERFIRAAGVMALKLAAFIGRKALPKALRIFGFNPRRSQELPASKQALITVQRRQELIFNLAKATARADDMASWIGREMPEDGRADDKFRLATFIARAEGNSTITRRQGAQHVPLFRIQLHSEHALRKYVRRRRRCGKRILHWINGLTFVIR